MKEELKPCPFCESDDLSVHFDDGYSYYVWCGHCGSQTDNDHLTKKEAIKAWNTRPTEDVLKASNEKMRKALEKQCIACRMRDHECECGFCSIYEALANVEYFNTTEKNNEQTETQKHHA